jgi:hypothetical protein
LGGYFGGDSPSTAWNDLSRWLGKRKIRERDRDPEITPDEPSCWRNGPLVMENVMSNDNTTKTRELTEDDELTHVSGGDGTAER